MANDKTRRRARKEAPSPIVPIVESHVPWWVSEVEPPFAKEHLARAFNVWRFNPPDARAGRFAGYITALVHRAEREREVTGSFVSFELLDLYPALLLPDRAPRWVVSDLHEAFASGTFRERFGELAHRIGKVQSVTPLLREAALRADVLAFAPDAAAGGGDRPQLRWRPEISQAARRGPACGTPRTPRGRARSPR